MTLLLDSSAYIIGGLFFFACLVTVQYKKPLPASVLVYGVFYPTILALSKNLSEARTITLFLGLFWGLLSLKQFSIHTESRLKTIIGLAYELLLKPFVLGLTFGLLSIIGPSSLPALLFSCLWLLYTRHAYRLVLLFQFFGMLMGFRAVFPLLSALDDSVLFLPAQGTVSNRVSSLELHRGLEFALSWCNVDSFITTPERYPDQPITVPALWSPQSEIYTGVPYDNDLYYFSLGLQCIGIQPEMLTNHLKSARLPVFVSSLPVVCSGYLRLIILSLWDTITLITLLSYFSYPFLKNSLKKPWFLLTGFSCLYYYSPILTKGESLPILADLLPLFFIFSLPAVHQIFTSSNQIITFKMALPRQGAIYLFCLLVFFLTLANRLTQISQTTTNQVRDNMQLALDYLARHQKPDFSFDYLVNSRTGYIHPEEQIVRQMVTAQGLANAAYFLGDETTLKLHAESMAYIENSLIRYAESSVFVETPGKTNSINATAFAALAVADSPLREKYRSWARPLAQFFLDIQRIDGSFPEVPPQLLDTATPEIKAALAGYTTGQSIAACAAMYEYFREEVFLNCAKRAFTFYGGQVGIDPQMSSAPWYVWHTVAYSRLYSVAPDKEIAQRAVALAEHLLSYQNPPDSQNDIPGSFDISEPRISATEAAYLEAIGMAALVGQKEQISCRSNQLEKGFLAGLNALDAHVVKPNSHKSESGAIVNEVNPIYFTNRERHLVRIDNIGHALMAWNAYLKLIGLPFHSRGHSSVWSGQPPHSLSAVQY